MRRSIVAPALLLGLFLAGQAYGQDASLSGTVTDASGGVIPNTTVTAVNDNTGVVSTAVTNTAGVYSFPRLMFGVYTVKAEQKGFQPKTFTKVTLSAGQQARLNFQLEVTGVKTEVEVSTSAEQLILESSSSVGDVLTSQTVMDLPLVNRNALDLIKVMSGVIMTDDVIFGAANTSFAGVNAFGVNIQRDGVTVNDVRMPTGINAATRVNPDLVGEFRMILAPVDAEVGRGNAQIQIATKAGTNEYHGSLVWNVQNTALDPNTWENNRNGVAPPWRNMHQYSANVGGPIAKNRTFFFALLDGQLSKLRTQYNVLSITPCAQRGVFRFWDRWNNGNAITNVTPTGSNPVINTVDKMGNPLKPQWEPGAGYGVTPYTGQLRYASVFGTISNLSSIAPDCSNVQLDTAAGPWDPRRPAKDPSGFIDDFLNRLPKPNNYDMGDGLNTAGHRWSRTLLGADNLFGIGEDTYRRQINVRIDHNFTDAHRISGSWSYEKNWSDDSFKNWPNGYGGTNIRRPQVLTVNFISSIKPTLLNELKFGMSRTGTNVFTPATNPDNGDEVTNLMAQFGKLPNGEVALIGPGMGTFSFNPNSGATSSHWYGGRGGTIGNMIDSSPRYTWGDTMSWMKGSHSLRFGGEIRRASSLVHNRWVAWTHSSFPYASGGELPITPETFTNVVGDLAGSSPSSGNKRAFRDLLVFLSGSLGQLRQWRYINSITDTTWNDPVKEPDFVRETIQKEFSLFFKDDWKIRPDLTLNLGIRYDYYGVPYLSNGLTIGLEGGGAAILGPSLSPKGESAWFAPIRRGDVAPGKLVNLQSIGPDSLNPDISLYPKNWKNFGPAVGFAYQIPWFGKGKTTIRGGYQISYLGMSGNFMGIQSTAGQNPNFSNNNTWNNNGTWDPGTYFGIKDLKTSPLLANGVPVPPTVVPGIKVYTLYDRQQSISAYAPDYKHPYIQNLTFAITRNVTSNLTVDLRYIGTLTRRGFSSLNLNSPNFITNGLLEAFDAARRGEDPVLLDQLLNGLALPAYIPPFTFSTCVVNGTTCKGGAALRAANSFTFNLTGGPGAFTNMNQLLARGNYAGLANQINVLSGSGPGYTERGQFLETNGFPINFIKASPQFSDAVLNANQGHANYHSFQGQITLRPTKGLSFQSTYTWSKNLGINPASVFGTPNYTDPRNLFDDYGILSSNRPHNWVTYGTFDLPFGPGRSFGKSASGALAKVIGNWQISWISNVVSGAPMSITAQSGLYANGTPDVVNGGIDYDSAGAYWPDGAREGNYFGGRYAFVRDPQCLDPTRVAQGIPGYSTLCDLNAVVDKNRNNQIVLQNPLPGTKGNMGLNKFRNLARWNVDMSLSKSVMITETKSVRLRMDFQNVFNHPIPSGTPFNSGTRIVVPTAPAMNINGTSTLGLFNYKVGGRTFQLLARFDF